MEKRYTSEKSAKAAVKKQGLHRIEHTTIGPIDDSRGGYAVQFYLDGSEYAFGERDVLNDDINHIRNAGFRAELKKEES